jgi:hypothetical protein
MFQKPMGPMVGLVQMEQDSEIIGELPVIRKIGVQAAVDAHVGGGQEVGPTGEERIVCADPNGPLIPPAAVVFDLNVGLDEAQLGWVANGPSESMSNGPTWGGIQLKRSSQRFFQECLRATRV